MTFALGETPSDSYFALLVEELALPGDDLRAPAWRKDALDPDRPFQRRDRRARACRGCVAAHRLAPGRHRPVIVIEKNAEVGGTWLENRLPGLPGRRAQPPLQLLVRPARRLAAALQHPGDVLLDYFRRCADDLGVREHIRFATEVLAAAYFDEHDGRWQLHGAQPRRRPRRPLEVERAWSAPSASSTGPSLPDDRRARVASPGPSFHSARVGRRRSTSTGKRVAVIGTGASAHPADPGASPSEAAELLVFQRTPQLVRARAATTTTTCPTTTQWLLRARAALQRSGTGFWLFWRLAEGIAAGGARSTPTGQGDPGSVGARSDELRDAAHACTSSSQFGDAPELLAAGRAAATRRWRSACCSTTGSGPRTLKRDDVHLITDPIERDHADGRGHRRRRATHAGRRHRLRHRLRGVAVPDADAGDRPRRRRPARALGRRRPRLPRHHRARLPQPVLPLRAEHEPGRQRQHHLLLRVRRSRYIARVPAPAARDRHAVRSTAAPRCTRPTTRAIDEGNAQMAWGASDVNSWYKNARRAGHAELAGLPARVLERPAARPRRLRARLTRPARRWPAQPRTSTMSPRPISQRSNAPSVASIAK